MAEKKPSGLLLFEGFVLCEEARAENNGKFFFIGVYNDAISFPSFPARLPFLTFANKVKVIEAGKYDFSLEIKDTDDQTLAKATGGFEIPGSNIVIWLPLTLGNIVLARPGTYKAFLTLGENPPIRISFDAVKVQPAPRVAQGQETKPN